MFIRVRDGIEAMYNTEQARKIVMERCGNDKYWQVNMFFNEGMVHLTPVVQEHTASAFMALMAKNLDEHRGYMDAEQALLIAKGEKPLVSPDKEFENPNR